jgi:arylsulfatase A-like enzyme
MPQGFPQGFYDNCVLTRRALLATPVALLAAETKTRITIFVAPGWRGQATPWAGDPDLIAPNLARFAEQSIVIPRAYASCPRRREALASIATGRYPHTPSEPDTGAESLTIVSPDTPRSAVPLDAAKMHPRKNVSSDNLQQLAGLYGTYRAIDDQFGKFLTALEPSTIAVFTSDCGEQLDSHGLFGNDVWFEESVRIPLAIRLPQTQPHASDLLVSQTDLLPTLLGLRGEPKPENAQGRDLSALLAGSKGDRPESIFAEGKLGTRDEWKMLVLGVDKIVTTAQGEATHMFNLADDPYELVNLAHEPSVKLKRDLLLAELRAERQRLLDFRRR